jgi:hypothetical protein
MSVSRLRVACVAVALGVAGALAVAVPASGQVYRQVPPRQGSRTPDRYRDRRRLSPPTPEAADAESSQRRGRHP